MRKRLVTVAAVLLVAASAPAATRLVPTQYPTIQAAIDDSNDRDEVVVLRGTYTGEGNRDIDFLGKAITVRSTDPNDPGVVAATIIDCNAWFPNWHRGVIFDSNEGNDSVLSGITITNGWQRQGGGIYCGQSSPTIMNCRIVNNRAHYGGAIACFDSNCVIRNCRIEGNYVRGCGSGGGGIYLRSCSASIEKCTITRNTSQDKGGGGIFCCGGRYQISHCLIFGNKSHDRGGGLACTTRVYCSGHTNAEISCCTIADNRSHYGGGGIGIYSSHVLMGNSILWANRTSYPFGGNQIELQGSSYALGELILRYCNIEDHTEGMRVGWHTALTLERGNIDADPLFVQPGQWDNNSVPPWTRDNIYLGGDCHLLATSPCVDAGDPNYVVNSNETDIDGEPRVWDGRIDMGADEFVPAIEVAMKFTPQALNPDSKGNWMKAHFVLPEGCAVGDVDANRPAVVEPGGIESDYMNVFVNDDNLVEIEAAFDRVDFCTCGPFAGLVMVEGVLTTGQQFYGTDTIKITANYLKYLGTLASRWLETGCGKPDWCSGLDLDQNSAVDFTDYALFDGCCIEVVRPAP